MMREAKRCAIAIIGLVMGALVLILVFGDKEDRRAGVFMSFLVIFASSVTAITAAMFARNLQNVSSRVGAEPR